MHCKLVDLKFIRLLPAKWWKIFLPEKREIWISFEIFYAKNNKQELCLRFLTSNSARNSNLKISSLKLLTSFVMWKWNVFTCFCTVLWVRIYHFQNTRITHIINMFPWMWSKLLQYELSVIYHSKRKNENGRKARKREEKVKLFVRRLQIFLHIFHDFCFQHFPNGFFSLSTWTARNMTTFACKLLYIFHPEKETRSGKIKQQAT